MQWTNSLEKETLQNEDEIYNRNSLICVNILNVFSKFSVKKALRTFASSQIWQGLTLVPLSMTNSWTQREMPPWRARAWEFKQPSQWRFLLSAGPQRTVGCGVPRGAGVSLMSRGGETMATPRSSGVGRRSFLCNNGSYRKLIM